MNHGIPTTTTAAAAQTPSDPEHPHHPSGRTGPIIFNHDDARQYLVRRGFVFTFRAGTRTVGETWAAADRGAGAFADVDVRHVAHADPSDTDALAPFAHATGLDTPERWRDAIREVNAGLPPSGNVYQATLTDVRRPEVIHAALRGEQA